MLNITFDEWLTPDPICGSIIYSFTTSPPSSFISLDSALRQFNIFTDLESNEANYTITLIGVIEYGRTSK